MPNNWNKKDDKFEFLDKLSKKLQLKRFEAMEMLGKSPNEANQFLDGLEKQGLILIEKGNEPPMDLIKFPGAITKRSFNDIFKA